MSTPYVGELRLFPFSLCPKNWLPCEGQILSVKNYPDLSSVLQATYGGDGTVSFGLPDLRSRTPVHLGQACGLSYTLGMAVGAEEVTLTSAQMPAHTHPIQVSTASVGDQSSAANNFIAPVGNAAALSPQAYYTSGFDGQNVSLAAATIGATGGGAPHANLQPVLALAVCICISGKLPSS